MVNAPIRYAEALLTGMLGTFGLDIEYVRAEKNTLYYLDDDGTEVGVLDLVGGWGSVLLGHNHPEIVARAKELLDAGSPVHSQHSAHPVADQVGALLNGIIGREIPGAEPYSAYFANTGAEAVEAAVKHCEFDRALRMKSLFEQIEWNADVALNAVRDGSAALPDDTSLLPGDVPVPTTVEEFGGLLGAVAGHNIAKAGTTPVFFALERAFHGKLVGSTQFTYNPLFRAAFASLGLAVHFVPPNDAKALADVVAEQRVTVLDLEIVDGRVTLVEKDFPAIAGFIVEPIQGEGGIHELTADYAAEIRKIGDEAGFPIVADEIQTGMGRTGKFFASSHIGLVADYYLLGKSLGGGIGKTSVMLTRLSRYRPEFELVHSSTFAKDGFTTPIALRTLEVLEADDGAAYRLAAERGERILGMLRDLAAEFPDVVVDVRGKGLLIGLEFADQSQASSPIIREKALAGLLVFQLGSYLQLAHRIRTGPTASVPTMLRIEPSIYISDEEIDQLRTGLTDVCQILRNQDALPLIQPLTGVPRPRTEIKNFRRDVAEVTSEPTTATPESATATSESTTRKVGFVGYPLTADALRELDPSLADLDDTALVAYTRRSELLKDLPALAPVRFDSPQGASVDLTVYPLLVTQDQLREYQVSGQTFLIGVDLDRRVRAAKADGCDSVGLGFGLGAVVDHGRALRVPGVTLTTGALAAGSTLTAVEHAATERFGRLDGLTVAVVGGGGRVGSTIAALCARRVAKIILVGSGRPGSAERLRTAECRIYQEAWARIAVGGELTGIPAALAAEPLVAGWLAGGRAGDEPSGEAIAAHLDDAYDTNPYVVTTDDLSAARTAHVVIAAHSSPVPVLDEKHLGDSAIVGDLSFLGTGAESAAGSARPDIRYLRCGVLSGPRNSPRSPGLAAGEWPAGMVEAVTLALSGNGGRPTEAGAWSGEQVDAVVDLAKENGFHTMST